MSNSCIITLVKDVYQFCSYLLFFVWLLIAYVFYCSCSVTELWCLTLCHHMDCSLIGSSVHRISQARMLEWVAISFRRGSTQSKEERPLESPALAGAFFVTSATCGCWVLSLLSCVPLCDPTDCRPPGSSIHGILQARMLEWVAISFSRGTF